MSSKKMVLSADGTTATVADATLGDIVTSVFTSDTCVTGAYGFVQKAALVIGGMAVQNNRLGNGLNPFA
jgi:hypothetical protein